MSKDHQTEQKTPINASETVKANPDVKTSPHLDIQKINELVRVFIIFVKLSIVKLSIILTALSLLIFIGVLVITLSVSSRMFSTSSVISTSPVTSSSIAT